MAEHDCVSQEDFISACDKIIEEEKALSSAKDHTVSGKKSMSPEQENALKTVIKEKLAEQKEKSDIQEVTQ